ncbi:tRNA pseudouridine(55) synthase TruB [Virgibacillus profundi]|uniref:tRNA pseudouridine synthase B n=1 Tax=Virgibacillus profundi TaxID=2024555 RepID=A0A2A2IG25_9BACI|nr:tRNA pseudouridine(55) synthase TruB [Virgibacillus profundi]PAV30043.1 tRNA pseudouridine(55) synthase TruB [Virgibacillus profundi]PXY54216.1 tRNA pseudouridine(55) synthase TruB [Virgibacillus profundi]
MNGILPLWKPKGMTSHDCVMIIRKLFKTKKVGHTGTLDPEVEGVLPICIGQATKIVPFLTDTKKTYIAEVMLGKATDTEDSQGKVIEEKEVVYPPTDEEIEEVLTSFNGTITQIPPMYSAVKVNGKKLYEYARANEHVERPTRKVVIHHIEKLPTDKEEKNSFRMKIICSKGTYIRTLCVDIGNQLGYPAHMSHLIRTETAAFKQQNTVTFATIEEKVKLNQQDQLLLSILSGLDHLDKYLVDDETKKRVLNGQKLPKPEQRILTDPFIMMHEQQLLAIYQIHPEKPDQIKPVRVFNN